DAIVSNYYPNLSLLLGKGDGTFANPIPIPVNFGASLLAAADFNHDGKLDLALGGGSTASIMFGNGDGSFQQPLNTAIPVSANALLFADFNGDGQLDLATTSAAYCCPTFNLVFVLLGNGKGTFGSRTDLSLSTFSYGVGPSVVADFNGDGKLDLAVPLTNYNPTGVVSVLPGKGDGT